MLQILATGGTIAGETDLASGSRRYQAGVRTVERLLDNVPELTRVASIRAEQVMALDSKDMHPSDWIRLRGAIRRAEADPAISGIVVLHGTDTLEETAWYLHLTTSGRTPLVLTGAMHPADHPEADGPANLLAAAQLAAATAAQGKGVLIVLHGQIHGARMLSKVRTTGLDAFGSSGAWQQARPAGQFAHLDTPALPPVAILPGYAGAPPELIESCLATGHRGLVLALTGHGSVPATWLPALRQARHQGVAILRASRCTGPVIRNANADDDGEGWLTAGDLPPPKARIALMLALAAGWSHDRMALELPTL
ncbi:asparaginase [Zoogloea sp.]|uniref:asparaginase n=1 Tax=Zoogloea sp. TaxID=49181 RepID=UPI00260CCCB4|nr:asparaginase [Zoogloea sp.]MDD3352310.1 asparaginase [Zoogloea sp.]